jgi:hypothetical protein
MSNTPVEDKREFWANIAKANGWYKEPFYVAVWIDPETNKVWNSVSQTNLTKDVVIYEKETD